MSVIYDAATPEEIKAQQEENKHQLETAAENYLIQHWPAGKTELENAIYVKLILRDNLTTQRFNSLNQQASLIKAEQERKNQENAKKAEIERRKRMIFENQFPSQFRARDGDPQQFTDWLREQPIEDIKGYIITMDKNRRRFNELLRFEFFNARQTLEAEIERRQAKEPKKKGKKGWLHA